MHDDVANILGGVAGHAGIFGTADDVAVIGQLLLDGGSYSGKRILVRRRPSRRMLTNANAGQPAIDPDRPQPHRPPTASASSSTSPGSWASWPRPATFGHTGFTGTSLLVDPDRKLVLVLLTNRAHPNWSWADPDPARVEAAKAV